MQIQTLQPPTLDARFAPSPVEHASVAQRPHQRAQRRAGPPAAAHPHLAQALQGSRGGSSSGGRVEQGAGSREPAPSMQLELSPAGPPPVFSRTCTASAWATTSLECASWCASMRSGCSSRMSHSSSPAGSSRTQRTGSSSGPGPLSAARAAASSSSARCFLLLLRVWVWGAGGEKGVHVRRTAGALSNTQTRSRALISLEQLPCFTVLPPLHQLSAHRPPTSFFSTGGRHFSSASTKASPPRWTGWSV